MRSIDIKGDMNYKDYIKTGNTVFYKGEPVVLDGIYDIEFNNFASEEDMDQNPQLCIAHIYELIHIWMRLKMEWSSLKRVISQQTSPIIV